MFFIYKQTKLIVFLLNVDDTTKILEIGVLFKTEAASI